MTYDLFQPKSMNTVQTPPQKKLVQISDEILDCILFLFFFFKKKNTLGGRDKGVCLGGSTRISSGAAVTWPAGAAVPPSPLFLFFFSSSAPLLSQFSFSEMKGAINRMPFLNVFEVSLFVQEITGIEY